MAIAGRMTIQTDFTKFGSNLDVAMRRVQRGTKKATTAACEEILEQSLLQVPRDTETLASTARYDVYGSYTNFVGVVSYGGASDAVNPETGEWASEYMVAVHEDLDAIHPIGKAKFLEDPVRQYQARLDKRFAKYIRDEIGGN